MTTEYEKFTQEHLDGLYQAIFTRRDVRSYRQDEVEDALLLKILNAAHHAPSVGFMQPWNFLLIRNIETRKAMYDHFLVVNEKAGNNYQGDRKLKYDSLKLQGILDAPVNLLVTCDRTRGGQNVLGRDSIPDTDIYSTCLAIQNLWLAARGEGLGVGWISIMEVPFVREYFRLPEHVLPVAYLTIGHPVFFAEEPMLQTVGWRKREELDNLVFAETWGTQAGLGKIPAAKLPENPAGKHQDNVYSATAVADRMNELTKPAGSLGVLEDTVLAIARIQQKPVPQAGRKTILLFAGDHGVTEEKVSAYQQRVTAQMMYQFMAGGGAINSFARNRGIRLVLCDVGVNHDFGGADGMLHNKVASGTRNFLREPAMTADEMNAAIGHGRNAVRDIAGKCDILGLGEMGIGNTTASTAIICQLLGLDPGELTGEGTGIGSGALENKVRVIKKGLSMYRDRILHPLDALRFFGGFEIAALAGAIDEAHVLGIPVVLDGLITGAAALVSWQNNPDVRQSIIAGHLSREPAHKFILEAIGLKPLLDMELRLGEGSGAALAMGIIDDACRFFQEMKTFTEANITLAKVEF